MVEGGSIILHIVCRDSWNLNPNEVVNQSGLNITHVGQYEKEKHICQFQTLFGHNPPNSRDNMGEIARNSKHIPSLSFISNT